MSERTPGGARPRWRIWIDTGGTFTDGIGVDPNGVVRSAKVLSSGWLHGRVRRRSDDGSIELDARWPSAIVAGGTIRLESRDEIRPALGVADRLERPGDDGSARLVLREPIDAAIADRLVEGAIVGLGSGEAAPIVAARMLTGTAFEAALPPIDLRLATTRGTNALLERTTARTALVVTEGFADLLAIGDQRRPALFRLGVGRPAPVAERVVELRHRLAPDGAVLESVDRAALDHLARSLAEDGIEAAAVVLLHGHRAADQEVLVAEALRSAGIGVVRTGSEVAPVAGYLARAETTVVDAALTPPVEAHLAHVAGALAADDAAGRRRMDVLTSAGGLRPVEGFRPADALVSGPAGGVLGVAAVADRCGEDAVLGLDMGGTSTDVCRHAGRLDYRFEHAVGSVVVRRPALAIETVAAGGGSICDFVDGRLVVGPRSAGADPGPACYGRGGPLTVTDVNLLLGRLPAESFAIPVDRAAAEAALDRLLDRLSSADPDAGGDAGRDRVLEGLLDLADQQMAGGIERVSIRRGHDPTDHALVAFGGAGAQHACSVADRLGVRRVIVPPEASMLSAIGVGHAVRERFGEREVLAVLTGADGLGDGWRSILGELEAEVLEAISSEASGDDPRIERRILRLRLLGQEATVDVEVVGPASFDPVEGFRAAFADLYGDQPPQRPIELESVRVVAAVGERHRVPPSGVAEAAPARPGATIRARFEGAWHEVPAAPASSVGADAMDGPRLVVGSSTTLVVPPGWSVRAAGTGDLVVERSAGGSASAVQRPEAVEHALLANRLAGLAEEMGARLERTALSTNVRERMDFSCGLLDDAGRLIVNAPHVPVHLGAIGACVRRVAESMELRPGDLAITNHPAFGGSHLPDVTVIAPAFDGGGRLVGYAANRAHHAEIGGRSPGSMPADATRLVEEGIVIAPRLLGTSDGLDLDGLAAILGDGPWPSRAIEEDLADLQAQAASARLGAAGLAALADAQGPGRLAERIAALARHAASIARETIEALGTDVRSASDELDDGTPIAVRLEPVGGAGGPRLRVDFTGSGDVHPGNLNAPAAIARAAVLYVLQVLSGDRLPMNEAVLDPIDLVVPAGVLDPPFDPEALDGPAVVGGNVETSQRIVDVLVAATGLGAASQGTMNNLLFGDRSFGYYETIGGGAGATPDADGPSGLHVHMTNTRLTDPEILELRHPVRLERHALRSGSGGAGVRRGGDGVVRSMVFLRSLRLTLLTQRRTIGPPGAGGGAAGAPGRQWLERSGGERVELDSSASTDVEPGDRLVIETPGGGGFGAA